MFYEIILTEWWVKIRNHVSGEMKIPQNKLVWTNRRHYDWLPTNDMIIYYGTPVMFIQSTRMCRDHRGYTVPILFTSGVPWWGQDGRRATVSGRRERITTEERVFEDDLWVAFLLKHLHNIRRPAVFLLLQSNEEPQSINQQETRSSQQRLQQRFVLGSKLPSLSVSGF